MRLPRSLFGRLFATSLLALAAALLLAALAIGGLLERIARGHLNTQLDTQIATLVPAIRPDGSIDAARLSDPPPFGRGGSAWGWEIRTPRETFRSRSQATAGLDWRELAVQPRRRGDARESEPLSLRNLRETPLRGRMLTVATTGGPATVVAVAPRALVDRPIRAFWGQYLLALGALAFAWAAVLFVQLRLGLRPLRRFETMVEEVRLGKRTVVDSDGPSELQPLVERLNALIAVNARSVERARRQAGDLAHALKTPLARLRLATEKLDGDTVAAIDAMDRLLRRHLVRARSADAAVATPVELLPVIDELVAMLARVHVDRGIATTVTVAPDLAVLADADDLSEIVGNLLDNAYRWAGTRIDIAARRSTDSVELEIADDGPGIAPDKLDELRAAGARLDERPDSHGLGLAIVADLVEALGGTLTLDNRDTGGLCACVILPSA